MGSALCCSGGCLGCSFCEESDIENYEERNKQIEEDRRREVGLPTLTVKLSEFLAK